MEHPSWQRKRTSVNAWRLCSPRNSCRHCPARPTCICDRKKNSSSKERCRAIISILPCPLCRALLIALVLFVVTRINLLPVMGAKAGPHSCNRTSSREALTHRKMSYSYDLRVGFLDYVQLVEPVKMSTQNTLAPRTRRGVALLPLSNSSGAVKFRHRCHCYSLQIYRAPYAGPCYSSSHRPGSSKQKDCQ